MVFWRRWQDRAEQYGKLERLHENDYELQYGSSGNAQYSFDFYRLIGDGDPDFPHMAISIMQEILSPFKIVTHVKTWDFRLSKKRKMPNPQDYFPARYYSELVACSNAENAYYNQAMELITLTDGIDLPLICALLDRGNMEIRSNNLCLYAYLPYPFANTGFDSIKAVLNQDLCDICIVYEEQHDLLRFTVNHENLVVAESIVEVVKRICTEYHKHLETISALDQ